MASLAVWMKSSSTSDVPTALPGLEEGEGHAAADDDLVALLDERLEDRDLRGHLGAADDGGEGADGLVDGAGEVLELLREEVAGHGGREVLRDALGGGVRAVRRAERVVDEEVEGGRELLDEGGVVLGLLLVEARVLEEERLAVAHAVDDRRDLVADAVGRHLHGRAELLAHARGHGAERELVLGPVLGPAEVRAHRDLGALVEEVLDRRHGRADARVVADDALLDGDVEVAADEDLLALEVRLGEVTTD